MMKQKKIIVPILTLAVMLLMVGGGPLDRWRTLQSAESDKLCGKA